MLINDGRVPKVLIACPTSIRQKYALKEWIKNLNRLNYPAFDVLVVDNSEGDDYFNLLSKQKVHGESIKVIKHNWDKSKQHPLQMLADVRELIRDYFLNNGYDYLMFLDQDIFLPKRGLQRLLSYNKDHVGFYVHVFPKGQHKPCILKDGEIVMGRGLNYYTFAEINQYKNFVSKFKKKKLSKTERNLVKFVIADEHRPQLFRTYAVGIGCCMIRRNVLEQCHFRTHPTFIWGEDLWYFAEANDKKFEFWVDTSHRCVHKNIDWGPVLKKSSKEMGFYVVQGPSDAKDADFLVRDKTISKRLKK